MWSPELFFVFQIVLKIIFLCEDSLGRYSDEYFVSPDLCA